MKCLSADDRPREKLLRMGPGALGDNELLALVLGVGSRQADALTLAGEVLSRCSGIHGLAKADWADLARVNGIGPCRAARIRAAVELGRRSMAQPPNARVRLRAPSDAAAFLQPRFGANAREQFGIVLLDVKHRVLRTVVVSMGTSNATVVEPRDVFREALLGGAAAVIAFHNHPSGDPTPSAEDRDLTRRLAAAGALMGVQLADHVVLGEGCYSSFRDLGWL
jgi:DNA repair protein RadC